MQFNPGARVGAYEILAALGAGGMGEVYRARDTRLGRDVAIKTLPDLFVADSERIARFQREAQVLASLNHPHIAAIHGVEDADGAQLLVLEFVEGESLADRLARGRLPVADALGIARQIVEALEAAHEKGVVHRDLKPANIMVTADDRVKVLDFGLAKFDPVGSQDPGVALTQSPTMTFAATQAGVILGTAAYMSPEQAKGRATDKRSDVWAFGCVLYEMLTGSRAFGGEDVSDTLAAILRGEPDWTALPDDVPPHVRMLIAQCLRKDRQARAPDIAVARFALEQTTAPLAQRVAPGVGAGSWLTRVWPVTTALFAVTTILALALARSHSNEPARPLTRFAILPPEGTSFIVARRPAAQPAISPDGSMIVFAARDASGKTLLWIRAIDAVAARPLAGTDEASYPFWSPDGRFVGYTAPGKLMKVPARGGPTETLCTLGGPTVLIRGGAWNADGTIVFSNAGLHAVFRVPAVGGEPTRIAALPDGIFSFNFPTFLPDGHTVLSYGQPATGSSERPAVYATSVATGESRRLFEADTGARYAADAGYVLFVRQGTLLAQKFDPKSLSVLAEPVAVAEQLEFSGTAGLVSFSVSSTGVLAFATNRGGATELQLTWVDREGKSAGTVGPAANYRGFDLSPDGERVIAHRHVGQQGGDVWVTDVKSGRTARLTSDDSQENASPVWSPDGRSIAFGSRRDGKSAVYRRSLDGAGSDELLVSRDALQVLPESWSADGSAIVFTDFNGTRAPDLWMLSLNGDRRSLPLLDSVYIEAFGQLSPDGRWLAFISNEAGREDVYVRSFPQGSGKQLISTAGGSYPRWRRDGRELFYIAQMGGMMMSVEITRSGAGLEAGLPRPLFESGAVNYAHTGPYQLYDVAADGNRFLIARAPSSSPPSIVVIENWTAALPK